MGDVLTASARRWQALGATSGEWMAIVVCMMKGSPIAGRVEPDVVAAARALGPEGLSFLAACVWPPVNLEVPAELRCDVDAAGLPW